MPEVSISLDDDCVVTARPYLVGEDEIHLVIDCSNGTLRTKFGDVALDGNLHVQCDRESFAKMVSAAKLSGAVAKVNRLVGGMIRRGPPLLR